MSHTSTDLPDVDICFNCYEKTYTHVINERFITETCEINAFKFKNRIIIINNVNNRHKVELMAENLVQKRVIDRYFFVDDFIEQTLNKLQTTRKDWGRIFHYSSWALVMLFVAKSKYIVHWDEYLTLTTKTDWITPSIKEMEKNRNILIACPNWTEDMDKHNAETYHETKDFYFDHYFTDLAFLVNRFRLLIPMYQYHHVYSSRYPLFFLSATFESRIDSHERRYNLSRIVYKHCLYKIVDESPNIGANYPKFSLAEKIRNIFYYLRLKFFNLIYDPKNNRYYFRTEFLIKYIKENLLNYSKINLKIRRFTSRLGHTLLK